MYIAHNYKNQRVHIDNINRSEKYYCPICNSPLMVRDGEIRRKHFAHIHGASKSCDGWASDMSDWHRDWQEKFPEECREVVIEWKGEKHRADVCVNNVIIEFQHSRISKNEFEKRNSFYTSAGYKLIWLFDFSEDFEDKGYFDLVNYCGYRWKYHWKNFEGYDISKNKNISIWFQLKKEPQKYKGIKLLTDISADCRYVEVKEDIEFGQSDFVVYIMNCTENESEEKKPQTLYEIVESCEYETVVVYNIEKNYRFKLTHISRKRNYMRKHPEKDIFGYMGFSTDSRFHEKEFPINRSHFREWIVQWVPKNK